MSDRERLRFTPRGVTQEGGFSYNLAVTCGSCHQEYGWEEATRDGERFSCPRCGAIDSLTGDDLTEIVAEYLAAAPKRVRNDEA